MSRTEIKELTKINKMVAPWIEINPERIRWTVTLRTGTQVTVCCPVEAAVEVEEAGHLIQAERL